MKKQLFLFAIVIAFSSGSFAQDEGTAYSQGQSTVAIGYGIGNIWKSAFKLAGSFSGGTYKVTSAGPFALTYEYGATENISVGVALGYSQIKGTDSDPTSGYTEKLTNMSAIIRGNYHFGSSEKFDPYIGTGLGYYKFKYSSVYKDGSDYEGTYAIPGALAFSGQLGAKYYFAPTIAAVLEVGYVAGSYGQVGVNFKF
jgi:outer membrane protein W